MLQQAPIIGQRHDARWHSQQNAGWNHVGRPTVFTVASDPAYTPAMMSLCPPRYLVALSSTTSKPRSAGLQTAPLRMGHSKCLASVRRSGWGGGGGGADRRSCTSLAVSAFRSTTMLGFEFCDHGAPTLPTNTRTRSRLAHLHKTGLAKVLSMKDIRLLALAKSTTASKSGISLLGLQIVSM